MWVILCGSPRANGKSARIARLLEAKIAQARPDIEVQTFSVSDLAVRGCNGCEYCATHETCVMHDDMDGLLKALSQAEKLFVITPVYFAGVPSQFKAVLDRMQPLFWKRQALKKNAQPLPEKKRATVFVVGDGGDPHGYDGLVVNLRSALALCDYAIDEVYSFIGPHAQVVLPDFDAQGDM